MLAAELSLLGGWEPVARVAAAPGIGGWGAAGAGGLADAGKGGGAGTLGAAAAAADGGGAGAVFGCPRTAGAGGGAGAPLGGGAGAAGCGGAGGCECFALGAGFFGTATGSTSGGSCQGKVQRPETEVVNYSNIFNMAVSSNYLIISNSLRLINTIIICSKIE